MPIFRKILCSALLGVSLAVPFLAAAPAQANPPQHGHQRVYWVYYRSCPNSAWVCYGGYYHANEAQQAVNYFRHHGYESYYR
jgi:hypothetical protein